MGEINCPPFSPHVSSPIIRNPLILLALPVAPATFPRYVQAHMRSRARYTILSHMFVLGLFPIYMPIHCGLYLNRARKQHGTQP